MLLLDVRAEIPVELEHEFNEWYYLHVPRLLSFPGYTSGRRYIRLTDGPKYAALYEIADPAQGAELFGASPARHWPVAVSEREEWNARFKPRASQYTSHLYECAAGDLLTGDWPIVELRFDVSAERRSDVAHYCDTELQPSLAAMAGVRRVDRLSAPSDPDLAWRETRPQNAMLLQVESDAIACEIVKSPPLGELEARTDGDLEIVAYTQIARHWPFFDKGQP